MNTNNQFCLVLLLLLLGLSVTQLARAQSEIVGNWLTEDRSTHVHIYPVAGKYAGKITWSKAAADAPGKPALDTENPDKARRSRPIVGLVLLENFSYRNGRWEKGTIYDPESGKTYKGELTMDGGKLKVKGSVLFISRTETWQRLP